jgi:TRAP-type uncharacterized transport system substrate-binding protein
VLANTLFNKCDAVIKANVTGKGISLETARTTDPVPLHRGARAALDKLGVT